MPCMERPVREQVNHFTNMSPRHAMENSERSRRETYHTNVVVHLVIKDLTLFEHYLSS